MSMLFSRHHLQTAIASLGVRVAIPAIFVVALSACVQHNDELVANEQGTANASPTAATAAPSTGEAVPAATAPAAETTKPAPVIDERKYLEDKSGQWAATARASSSYASGEDPKAGYSAWQTTGAPNVARYSDDPAAWTTKSGDSKEPAWLEIGFTEPVHATSVRVRQTSAPGVISKLELLDELGVAHEVWAGVDETPYADKAIGWFVQDFAPTSYRVKGARLTLLPARVWGWNEIDAVQLVGAK